MIGVDNFSLSYVALAAYVLISGMLGTLYAIKGDFWRLLFVFPSVMVVSSMVGAWIWHFRRKSRRAGTENAMNPAKENMAIKAVRQMTLVVAVFFILSAALPDAYDPYRIGSSLGLVCSLYFLSCTPLPPGNSMVKKVRDKLMSAFETQPEPIERPS
jgi:hypothetical protein